MRNDNSNKMVVSVGVGSTQLPFIRALKDRGYQVAGFGKGRNDIEAINICDYFCEIDTSNYEEAINWLTQLPSKVFAVGSYAGGVAIRTLQEIARTFNLPTEIPNTLSVGMDKFEQQKLYEKFKLSTIKTFHFKDINDNPSHINGISKFIIKPSIGRGSAGVLEVNRDQLDEMLMNKSLNEKDLIQEMKIGEEYRILVIVQNYEIKLLAPIKRESFHESFLLGRLSYHSDSIVLIKEYISDMINNLNLKDGIIKADLIAMDNKIDMIEMDIGVGGGIYFKQFIGKLFEYDIANEYINLITSNEVKTAFDVNDNLVMDYVYNLTGHSIVYDIKRCEKKIFESIGTEVILIPNLLRPELTGDFGSNSDFIFCVIHSKKNLSNYELNKFINSNLFMKGDLK